MNVEQKIKLLEQIKANPLTFTGKSKYEVKILLAKFFSGDPLDNEAFSQVADFLQEIIDSCPHALIFYADTESSPHPVSFLRSISVILINQLITELRMHNIQTINTDFQRKKQSPRKSSHNTCPTYPTNEEIIERINNEGILTGSSLG